MGEIADMMLDGTLCQHCGGYIGSDNGFPTSCGCEDDDDDMAATYKAMNDEKRKRHAEWKTINMAALDKSGIPYRKASEETILFRQPGKPKVDFYPSTGRWRVAGQSQTMRGGAAALLAWYNKQ